MVIQSTHLPLGVVEAAGTLEGVLTTYGSSFALLGGGRRKNQKKSKSKKKRIRRTRRSKGRRTKHCRCKVCHCKTCTCNKKNRHKSNNLIGGFLFRASGKKNRKKTKLKGKRSRGKH